MTRPSPIRPLGRLSFLAVLAAIVLAACGTTDTGDSADSSEGGGGGGTDTEQTSAPLDEGCEDDVAVAEGSVSVTDAFDRTVELDEPASRVAVLEWQQVEDVLTLCLAPVAVADVEGYGTWVDAVDLPEGVEDVGTRGEPNIDALLSADPDLVIVEASAADDPVIEQIEGYDIPVLATRGADAADPIAQMLATFGLIAEVTGRTERAEAVVAEFEDSLEAGREAMTTGGAEGTEFVYIDGYIQGGNVALRPFGQGSLMGEVGEELGLVNAWTGEVDEDYGLGQTDIEGMSAIGDATILHTDSEEIDSDVISDLMENPVWSSLPAVVDGRVHAFPLGTWTFGGPRSTQQVIDAYVDVFTS